MLNLASSCELTLCLQPRREILQIRLDLLQFRDIGTVSLIVEPLVHQPQIFDQPQDDTSNKPIRRGQLTPCLLLEDVPELRVCQVIAGEAYRFAGILLGMEECLRGEEADVTCRDQLQGLALQRGTVRRGENFAQKVGRKVVHERHGAENGVGHGRIVLSHGEEMLLNIMLADEVWDVGRVGAGGVATAVNRTVDKVFDLVGEGGVDEGFALLFCKTLVHDELVNGQHHQPSLIQE